MNQRLYLRFEHRVGTVHTSTAGRTVRFVRGKVRLYLVERRQIGHRSGHLFHRGGAVFCDNMDMTVFRALSTSYIDVDEGAEAVVFAEIATRIFIAGSAITDVRNGLGGGRCRWLAPF